MGARHSKLCEKHILGPDTLQYIVREADCPALAAKHISHVGIGDGALPLHIVRTHLSGAYLHGTLGGEGRMLLDGRWQQHRPGQTSLAPAHVLHAFRAIASSRWQYCWVRYTPQAPMSTRTMMAPVLTDFDARPLAHAIMGLYLEMQQARDAGSCQLWVDAIERYVDRFVAPWREEQRLVRVWGTVQEDLARPCGHSRISPALRRPAGNTCDGCAKAVWVEVRCSSSQTFEFSMLLTCWQRRPRRSTSFRAWSVT